MGRGTQGGIEQACYLVQFNIAKSTGGGNKIKKCSNALYIIPSQGRQEKRRGPHANHTQASIIRGGELGKRGKEDSTKEPNEG